VIAGLTLLAALFPISPAVASGGPPTLSVVTIDQANPITSETLTVTTDASDPETDPLTFTYEWFKDTDGGPVSLGGGTTSNASGITLDLSVPGNGDKGDQITVRVSVADDTPSSTSPVDSAPVTVANSAPSQPTVSITPLNPRTNQTLTATPSGSTDADDDTITYTYVWKVEGVTKQTGSSNSFNLATAGNGDKGEQITVTATPTDGETPGPASLADSVTVANSAPSLQDLVIDQQAPRTNAILTASFTADDPDANDNLDISYSWRVNGTQVGTGTQLDTSLSGRGDKGDVIRVQVTVDDGSAQTSVLSAPVTILNSKPTATVTISPNAPRSLETLTVSTTKADADDGDTVALSFEWRKNGNVLSGETGNSLDLSQPGNGDPGDVIQVRVTPNDGEEDGVVATDTVTVAPPNGTPTTSNSNLTTTKNTSVGVTLQASDPEDDVLTYEITNAPDHGSLSGTGKSRTYDPNNNYVGVDTFSFRVHDDGTYSGTATVTILVSDPTGIKVVDFAYQPKTTTLVQGGTARWSFVGPSAHTVIDRSGMGFFGNTGQQLQLPGSSLSKTFTVAGTYRFQCRVFLSMTGQINIPIRVNPTSGTVGTTYKVIFAKTLIPSGYVADVQIKRPGATKFSTWRSGLSALQANFTPDKGKGTYTFRARLRKKANGTAAAWSPTASIKVG
jgi:plastocyanin